jgi:signal transduction histidine kinase
VEITLFRAIQQLVTRARDEARASRVQVSLDMEGDAANLVVEDDGAALGFQSDVSSQKKQVEALDVLRQRVEMLGGKMEISSAGESGTVVRLHIPVEP